MQELASIVLVLMMTMCAFAKDNDGKWATRDPKLHAWFDHLASGKGLCCSFADGVSVEDVDWGTRLGKDGKEHYVVRLNGKLVEVPDVAVVTEPNKFGRAVVWPYQQFNTGTNQYETSIRCFMPGAGS